MRPRTIIPLLLLFLCTRVVISAAKLQQQATIDANADEDEDDRDDDDDDDIGNSRSEVDDDGRIYKNPRNSPSAICPRDEKQVEIQGQKCLRRCSTDEDCKSKKKKCRCDGPCGMSCIKPDRECPELLGIDNGKMTVTGRLFGDSAHYLCDHDHWIVGLSERTCRADGHWTGATPICKKDPNSFCTTPPKVNNAKHYVPIEQKAFDQETTVQYFCDYGYQTKGFHRAKCISMDNKKASWFGPDVTCEPINCGIPTDIPNGWHVGECYTYDCRVSYHCADGHRLQGKSERICLADGTWSPKDLPTCVQGTPAQCPQPDHPLNGRAIYTSYSYNAIVSYECKPDYVLVGTTTRRCQADRKWSGLAPICEEINCGLPGILYNGWIENIEAGTGLGASIIFRCNEHMKLEGNTSSVCQSDGKWRYPLPHCLAPCIIPQIEKGNITVASHERDHINNVTVVENSEKLNVHCVKNYEFSANNTPVICNNGTWSIIPSCAPARCKQMPKSPKNGMVIAPKMNHGMRAIFKCKDGFALVGGGPDNSSKHVECHYGTWIGDIPHCIEVYCAFPGYVQNGKVLLVGNMGVYDYRPYVKKVPNNKQIMYDCDKGYVLNEGPTGATCIGGNWSPKELPACLPGQHPRLRWSRRRRSIDALQANMNVTTNLKKFIQLFRQVGKKLLHLELEEAQKNAHHKDMIDSKENQNNLTVRNSSMNNNGKKIMQHSHNSNDKHLGKGYNRTINNGITRKKHLNHTKKSRSKDEKIIDFLKIVYRKLERIDSKHVNNQSNTTMHHLLNVMSKNFFHVDLSQTKKINTTRNRENYPVRNQHEFYKVKREFEKIIKFYNKSLRWSEKRNRKESRRRKTDINKDEKKLSKERKRNKDDKTKNYYRGFYEFINGYVNEKLSIYESQNLTEELINNMNIDKFTVENGTTFTVGEIYAFFKHIIENTLNRVETTTDITATTTIPIKSTSQENKYNQTISTLIINSSTTDIGLANEIPLNSNKTQIPKHRTKRIRNAAEMKTNINHQKRKLLSINSPLISDTNFRLTQDYSTDTQSFKSKQFTLNGLDAQQQSRSKRFLPLSELDNQIYLKNLYLNAYEDEYRANVRRSIMGDNGHSNWTALRRRKGNLEHYGIK